MYHVGHYNAPVTPQYHSQPPPYRPTYLPPEGGFSPSGATVTLPQSGSTTTPTRHLELSPQTVARPKPRPHQPQSPHTPVRAYRQNPQLVMDPAAFTNGSPTQHELSSSAGTSPLYGGERQAGLSGYNAAMDSAYPSFREAHMTQFAPSTSQMREPRITLIEVGPIEGPSGIQFTVKCDIVFDDPSGPAASVKGRAVRIIFGQMPLQTTIILIPDHRAPGTGQVSQLTATIPPWSPSLGVPSQSGRPPRVPMFLQTMIGDAVHSSHSLGHFSYGSPRNPNCSPYQAVTDLKREGEPIESYRTGPSTPRRMVVNTADQSMAYQTPTSQGTMASTYSPYGASGSQQSLSGQQASFAAAGPSQPALQRATQIPTTPTTPTSYSGPGKASLELQGDVSNMAKGWTQDEWQKRRRLVQFWRKQDGTNIVAAFAPISQHAYSGHQQSIIVSCIFREDDNQCYITSVDTIYLLEALIGNRFTVEEKNRIRRNLEGFRPQTVSKTKASSEEFFKLIMSFPNPKPRNIEKDVKVFTWDILGHALKKIIGKYTACYSGPMSPISAPPLPLPGFSAPYPSVSEIPPPLQQPSTDSYDHSAGSAPTLISDASDSQYNSSTSTVFTAGPPATPQLGPMGGHPGGMDPHTPVRPNGGNGQTSSYASISPAPLGGHDKHATDPYLTLSPTTTTSASPYGSNAGNPYWATPSANDGVIPSPGSASYAALASGGMGYGEPAPHYAEQTHSATLPHVHHSLPRHPSSNDLRVVYPGMSQ